MMLLCFEILASWMTLSRMPSPHHQEHAHSTCVAISSQSGHRICRILPARGVYHIIRLCMYGCMYLNTERRNA